VKANCKVASQEMSGTILEMDAHLQREGLYNRKRYTVEIESITISTTNRSELASNSCSVDTRTIQVQMIET